MCGLLDLSGSRTPPSSSGFSGSPTTGPPPVTVVVCTATSAWGTCWWPPSAITAVLDWELAHLGSPVEDLGWFCGRAWRFGSPLRAGGVGTAEELLGGYAEGGGDLPSEAELAWWEAYGTLRWGLICVLQASVHLGGAPPFGRAGCHRPTCRGVRGGPARTGGRPFGLRTAGRDGRPAPVGPSDRPTVLELLAAVREQLVEVREGTDRSTGFHLRVAGNVVAMVGREMALGAVWPSAAPGAWRRWTYATKRSSPNWCAAAGRFPPTGRRSCRAELVRDKLAVSHPGYWHPDPPGGAVTQWVRSRR